MNDAAGLSSLSKEDQFLEQLKRIADSLELIAKAALASTELGDTA